MMKKLFVMGLALSLCMLGLFTSLAQASEPRELCEKGTVLPDPGRHSLHSSVFGRLIDARNRVGDGVGDGSRGTACGSTTVVQNGTMGHDYTGRQ